MNKKLNLHSYSYVSILQRTGCQWEMLPHDLPPYTTVYGYFQKWQRKGIWQQIHDQVRHQLRQDLGRDEHSTVAISLTAWLRLPLILSHDFFPKKALSRDGNEDFT